MTKAKLYKTELYTTKFLRQSYQTYHDKNKDKKGIHTARVSQTKSSQTYHDKKTKTKGNNEDYVIRQSYET